jgi:hypothetical protein
MQRKFYEFLISKMRFVLQVDWLLFFFFVFFVMNLLFQVDIRDFIPILKDITVLIYDLLLKDWINTFQEYFNVSRVVADIQRWLLSFKKVVPDENIAVEKKTLSPWELLKQAVVLTIDIKEDDTYLDITWKTWLKFGPAIYFVGFVIVAYHIRPPGSDE